MATGTGKTLVAFEICWRLWNIRWNRTGEYRRPKMLYLSDRIILVDNPKDKDFAPLGEAGWSEVRLAEVISQVRDLHEVKPDDDYPNIGTFSFGRGVFPKAPISGMATSAKMLNRIKTGQFI